jgi:phosphatidylserine/phosphatidylglycerophosphate/cardiolipin synthase-like enzyme
MIQVFFNRPGFPVPIDELLQDIEAATQRVVLASAWFTDHTVAQALIECRASTKIALLNKGDLQRGVQRGGRDLSKQLMDARNIEVCVLGSESFEEGVMHHKFCLVDRTLVWTGSFNFTMHARRNYEALLRIDDPATNERFWEETVQLVYGNVIATAEGMTVAAPDEVINCHQCGREVDSVDVHWIYGDPLCPTCTQNFYERY